MTTQHAMQVVSGPSREVLFDALRLVGEDRTVKFEWVDPADVRREVEVKILAIGAVGDDVNCPKGGQCWNVQAYDVDDEVEGDRVVLLAYSTQSRTGSIDFCASSLVGPSQLPIDDIGQEGFFVEFAKNAGNGAMFFLPVGPFATAEERNKFVEEWKVKLIGDVSIFVVAINAIPGMMIPVPPSEFFGKDSFPEFPHLGEEGPGIDNSDDGSPDDPYTTDWGQ